MATWTAPLPDDDVVAGTAGHPAMHNQIVVAIVEARTNVDAVQATVPTADTLTGATAVGKALIKAATPADGRTAIGAGTSSVQLGASNGFAAPGNHTHGFDPGELLTGIPMIQPDSTATTLPQMITDLNTLLANLRTRGVFTQ